MTPLVAKGKRVVCLGLANLLKGTHFFGAKRMLLRSAGIQVGSGTRVVGPVRICTAAGLSIGANTWIGHDLHIEGNGLVHIGDNVDVAPNCTFATGGHKIGSSKRRAGEGASYSQTVHDGCWIGIGSLFVNEVDVGKGCVISAGSVVAASVADGVLAGGVPAKTIRMLED